VLLRVGPYGPYVQLGEEDQNGRKKPKRVSLLKNMDAAEVNLDVALQLLSLPRLLGEHPETGKPVQAGVGRFGPYVVHDGGYTSLRKDDNVLEIELDRALELIAAAANRKDRKGGGERTASKKNVLKALGEHPDGGAIQVIDGRYGPYVNYQKVNVTLPEGVTPESVTLEQALAWVNAKAGKKGGAARKSGAKTASAATKSGSTTAKSSSTAKATTTKTNTAKKSSTAVKASSVTKKGSTAKSGTTAKKSSTKKA
jgi:DNA topoisomerase I